MTDDQRKALLDRIAKDTVKAKTLTPEAARKRLIAEGLYNEDGHLSERYGGKVAVRG